MKLLLRPHSLVLLLLGLTGLLTVWLDQVSRWDSPARQIASDTPEYVAEHLITRRFDAEGKLHERLITSRMWQYPGKDDVFFDQPELHRYQKGKLQYHLIAGSGSYNKKSRLAFFDKKAAIIKLKTENNLGSKIFTSALQIDTVERIAHSTAPTVFYHGNLKGSSEGFIYDPKEGLLTLLSHTKIIYAN